MNYFVCTYGNIPEREDLFRRSLEERCYFLHSSARWPTAIEEIRCGDTLMLNSWGCIMAIGTATSGVEETSSESDNPVWLIMMGGKRNLSLRKFLSSKRTSN